MEINKVYSIKLNSGEELIAKVVSVTDTWVEINDPVSVAPSAQGMGLVPSIFTADHAVLMKLNTNSIAMYGITDDAVKNKYIEATTGISVPSKKIVLG